MYKKGEKNQLNDKENSLFKSRLRASILNSLHQLSDHVIILSLAPVYSFKVKGQKQLPGFTFKT